ncbi:MAG: 2-oxo acid dehydrogenase subunit E2 [Synechococcaceae cyanobacterium SM2_3_60]|nr:2-oxo acid dehydrogenase subunit E2 [Synechococcaceae cyanobacterium SM2_3_60]
MIREVTMPALSSTMESGKIVNWLKQEGDVVNKGDNILVVESDKADMDVESFDSGILAAILVEAGGSATVGSPIALIAETEADVAAAKAKAGQLAPTPANVAAPENPAPVTAAPAVKTPTAPVARISTADRVVASPVARRKAAELGLDLSTVAYTGERITLADVERAAQGAPAIPTTPKIAPIVAATTPKVAVAPLSSDLTPFNTLQQAVIRTMNASLTVPTFRVGYTITTTALDALYKQVKPKGVTMTALLAKAAALTLAEFPVINGAYSEAGLQQHSEINVAIAVAMPGGGLITPVLRQAHTTDLYSLARQWKDLVERARSKQLQPEEYNSGTFTISNLGMFGVDRFDAILPPNQGAILAVGASKPTVVATADAAIAIRAQMQVNLTCDHRIIYGADAAAFLQALANRLETQADSLTL